MQAAVDLPVATASCSPSTATGAAWWVSVSRQCEWAGEGYSWDGRDRLVPGFSLGQGGDLSGETGKKYSCVHVASVCQDALKTRNDLSRGAGALM